MPHYKMIIEYDGTGLVGWQQQPNKPSVQHYLQEALNGLTGESVQVFCAGRTDAGVHALGQVVSFSLEKETPTAVICSGLNYHIKTQQISVLSVEQVDESFHARFSAIRRSYRYQIINRLAPLALEANRAWHVKNALNVAAMQEAAKYLVGRHDFSSFRDSQCQAKSAVRTLDKVEVSAENDRVFIDVSARSFLHHMVRNITGTLVLVGKGKWEPIQVKNALEAKDRRASGPNAPACGLYFMNVDYS